MSVLLVLAILAVHARSDRITSNLESDTTISESPSASLAYQGTGSTQPTVTFSGCTFSNIIADADGGALWLSQLQVIVQDGCSFASCDVGSNSNGGAIFASNCGSIKIGAVSFSECGSSARDGSSIYTSGAGDVVFNGAGRVTGGNPNAKKISLRATSMDLSGWTIDCSKLTKAPLYLEYTNGRADVWALLTKVTFSGNDQTNALENGAIQVSGGSNSLTVQECIFEDLETKSGVFTSGAAIAYTVSESTFRNVVSAENAAVFFSPSTPTYSIVYAVVLQNCTISNAKCEQDGGGIISVTLHQVFKVTGTTFDGNSCLGGSIKWSYTSVLSSGHQLTFQNCTFKNHQIGENQKGFCVLAGNVVDAISDLKIESFVFIDNVFPGVHGICSLSQVSKLTFDHFEFDNTSLAEFTTDTYKGIVVLGDIKYDFIECVFTECHVPGKGGIIVVPEVSKSKMLAGAVGDVLLQGCEFTGCSSEQTAEVYIQCSKLTISGGTYSCPETKTSSFIEVWITGATNSTISATFSVNSQNGDDIANPMITLHSVKDSTTNFRQCTFTTTVENPTTKTLYVSLQNGGSVNIDKTVSFDVDVEDAVTQESGFSGSTDIQTPEPEPSGDTGGSGSGSGSGSSGGSSAGGDGGNNDNTGLIVGVTCGVIAALIVAGVIVVFVLMFRRRRRFPTSTSTGGKGKDDAEEPVSTGSATGWASKPGDDWDRAQDPGFAMQGNLQYTADAFD